MTRFWPTAIAALIAAAVIFPTGAFAQDASPPAVQTAAPALTQQQLDELVAPVALDPDPLLADILTASTYPLEVVEARRWLDDPANAALSGDALTAALAARDWDPSVKALVPFPSVLRMMDGHLDWMQRLGEAFLAQQADVMDAVQRMRQRAQGAGTLQSSPQQTVATESGIVTVAPPPSQMIYVPTYDPWCVYGPWPYPVSPPFYFSPWYGDCVAADYLVGFGLGVVWPFDFWEWGYFDWRRHEIRIDRNRYARFHPDREPMDDVWHHDPAHRVGVPYRDPRNIRQFQPGLNNAPSFRGYGREGAQLPSARPAPPAFRNFGPGPQIRAQSQRGQTSRQGMSAPPRQGMSAPPMPAAPRSFAPSGGGAGAVGRRR